MKLGRRLVVVHRWAGRPEVDFYPWLRRTLSRSRPAPFDEIRVPVMPNPNHPTIEAWVDALTRVMGRPTPALSRAVLIGHSVGAQAVLRWLSTLPPGTSVAGVLLVAPWLTIDDPWAEIAPWCETPLDLPRIRRAAPRIRALVSDDDPFTKDHDRTALALRNGIGADVRVVSGRGHFDHETEPSVLDAVIEW